MPSPFAKDEVCIPLKIYYILKRTFYTLKMKWMQKWQKNSSDIEFKRTLALETPVSKLDSRTLFYV